ncbi:KAP family NTPase [Nocardioides furvisabuli]|nr:KAP family NTPase [Nocardioides furvisabuli]
MVSTHSFESSTVFGLSGEWGSGKTSLVNMIVEELEGVRPKWGIARFTPWATSDVAGLLAEFYSSLAEVLPPKKGEKVRKALAVTASVAAPAANLIPFGGGVVAEGIRLGSEALTKSPSWQVAFNAASAELKELQKPILIVVDDIDRLHADELMALLKVVRLLGRFDGVQYLLAYDDETLYRSMTTSGAVTPHDGTAERFMEKIVQYPLIVPPMMRYQQITRLNDGLGPVLAGRAGDRIASGRLSELTDCFTRLLTTPRAIDRYIAQVKHHIPLLPPDEIDDEDVQFLTLVRVSFPALFNAIPRYRNELITGNTGELQPKSPTFEYVKFDPTPLLELAPEALRAYAQTLLVALFPNIGATGTLFVPASDRRQSVQHDEYFDRYFAMGILDHDVSDAIVASAVARAVAGEPLDLGELILTEDDSRANLVLGKAQAEASQPTDDTGRLQLALGLADVLNRLPSKATSDFSSDDQIRGWIADILIGLDKESPAEPVAEVLDRISSPPNRIQTWRRVENRMARIHGSSRPQWFDHVTATLVRGCATDFIEHLKLGDAAPGSSMVAYQAAFVLGHDPAGIRSGIADLLESGEASLSILASRLASTSGSGEDRQLQVEFEQEMFNELAPAGDDPWYHEPMDSDVDVHDLSWANRRRFVAGRVSAPQKSSTSPDSN